MNRTWSNCCSVWPKRWTDGFELGVQEGTRSVRQRGQVRLKWSQMILHCEVCCQADCNPHKSCCHNNMNTRSWWLHRYRDFFYSLSHAVCSTEKENYFKQFFLALKTKGTLKNTLYKTRHTIFNKGWWWWWRTSQYNFLSHDISICNTFSRTTFLSRVRSLPGVRSRHQNIDTVIIRLLSNNFWSLCKLSILVPSTSADHHICVK